MHISILLLVFLLIGAFTFGAFVAWNNTKSSLKAKLDGEIGKATGDAAKALTGFKAKL